MRANYYTKFECLFFYFCLFLAVSCSTTDANVTCLYRNATSKVWKLPQWYIDDEPISPHSIAEYHDTVWRMVYDYSGLSPGKHVFHGKLEQAPGQLLQTCCGPLPEVFLTLTVEDGKSHYHEFNMQLTLATFCILMLRST